jgi:hypothetical protein
MGFPDSGGFQMTRAAAGVNQHGEATRRSGILHRQRAAVELNEAGLWIHNRTIGPRAGWEVSCMTRVCCGLAFRMAGGSGRRATSRL